MRERPQRLPKRSREGGVRCLHAGVRASKRDEVGRIIQLVSQAEILGIDVVEVRKKTGAKILRDLPDIADCEDQILREFVLQLDTPVARHRRTAISWQDQFAADGLEAARSVLSRKLGWIKVRSVAHIGITNT